MNNQGEETSSLPYWQVNVPPHQRSQECPRFLLNLNPKDRSILSTPNSSFTPFPWPKVRSIVSTRRIDQFIRTPLALRHYHEHMDHLKQTHGSVIEYVLKERLHWEMERLGEGEGGTKSGLVVRGEKWGAENVRVLWNDWPYGVDEKIVHLVVWTKFWLDELPGARDELVPEVEREIVEYVIRTFIHSGGMKPEHVVWFKNWKSLKSVHAVEHFHVMLFDPDLSFVDELTGGDEPLSRRQNTRKED